MSARIITALCLFCLSLSCLAQRNEKEAGVIAVEPGDTTVVSELLQKAYDSREVNSTASIDYCLRAIRISKLLKFKKGEGRSLGILAWAYYGEGNFLAALETSYEGLKISEQIKDYPEIARSLNNVGGMAYHQKQYDKAIAYFRQAYSLSKRIGDKQAMARSLNNMASMFQLTMPASDSARIYAGKALAIGENGGDPFYLAVTDYILGDLYLNNGKHAMALKYFRRALAFGDRLSDAMKVETQNKIVVIFLFQNKVDQAFSLLDKNMAIAVRKNMRRQQANCYQLMGQAWKQEGNAALALDYFERYMHLHDSLFNEENNNSLAAVQSQADLETKQTQIELLTKDTLLQKDEMNRQQTKLYTAVGGLIGIVVFVGILIYGYKKIERTNVLLRQRSAELGRINSAKDKLFSIISHDFRSPLNSLKGILTLVENKHLNPAEFAALAEKLRKTFNAVSNDLENLLHWSMTQLQGIQTNSSRFDVQPIVEEHVRVFSEIAKAKNVQLTNRISKSLFGIADEDHIRLVIRNLINNAIKFTPPGGLVEISAFEASQYITINVSDTGVGMANEQIETLFLKDRSVSTKGTNQERGVGLGLLLCHEFVATNGGQLQVASEQGKGSVFSFTLKVA